VKPVGVPLQLCREKALPHEKLWRDGPIGVLEVDASGCQVGPVVPSDLPLLVLLSPLVVCVHRGAGKGGLRIRGGRGRREEEEVKIFSGR
jgi:hypothetical protein